MKDNKTYLVNNRIKAPKVRVIGNAKENLGVLDTVKAMNMASEQGLDLVLISPNTEPPVARIMDFKKFLYHERKDKAKAKVRSKKIETKEIRFKPFTGAGDLTWQIGRAREWLDEGNRVKVWVIMRGREMEHADICFEKLDRFITELADIAKPEKNPERKGNIVSVLLLPK